MAKKSRTQSVFDAFDRLSAREKTMVGVLVGAMFLIGAVVVSMIIGTQIEALEQRNENTRDTLAQVMILKDDYLRQKKVLDAQKALLDDNDVKLVRLMEKEAANADFEIEDFKEGKRFITTKHRSLKKTPNRKSVIDLVEESQTVTIRRISLAQLANFLAAIEARSEPVLSTRLTIDTLNSDRQVLRNIRLTVATYRNEEVQL